MKNVILNIDGKRVQVWAQQLENEIWFHFMGQTFVKELSSKSNRKTRKKSEAKKNNITAPMPGKILAIKVKEGDQLTKGSLVLVMEAMKMEYSLNAPAGCTVKAINCQVGDQVNLKQTLVELNFADSDDEES